MQDKELPKRKNIRFKDFDYSSNNYYFITICTKDSKPVLSSIVGDGAHTVPKKVILKPYGKIAEKHIFRINSLYENVCVEKYIIMPNHIHMLIFIDRFNGSNETVLNKANENNGTMWASSKEGKDYNGTMWASSKEGKDYNGTMWASSKEGKDYNGTMWASSPTADLSTVVRTFKTMVTKEIGTSIWQRSFYDEIIKDETHFQNVWDYIAFNALKEYANTKGEVK